VAAKEKSHYLDDVMQFLMPYIKTSKKQDRNPMSRTGKEKSPSEKESSETQAIGSLLGKQHMSKI
jgi:hypothetical protein